MNLDKLRGCLELAQELREEMAELYTNDDSVGRRIKESCDMDLRLVAERISAWLSMEENSRMAAMRRGTEGGRGDGKLQMANGQGQ